MSVLLTLGQVVDHYEQNGRATIVADVAADNSTDDTDALNAAVAKALAANKALILPPGTIKTTGTIVADAGASGKTVMIAGCGALTNLKAHHSSDALQIGASSGLSSSLPSGWVRDMQISTLSPGSPGTARTGVTGLKLRGRVQFTVSRVTPSGFDIAFDLINNNFGTQFENCRTQFSNNNVGINLREGPHSGSDLSFYNCWVSGRIAGYYMSPNGGGYRIKHGQASCGHVAGVGEGVIVAGKDYLAGSTGQTGMISCEGVDFEGPWDGAMIRTHGRVTAAFRDNSFLATKGSPNECSRLLHMSAPGASTIVFDGNSTRSTFANDDLLLSDNGSWSNDGGIYETGWVTSDSNTVTPTYNRRMSSLAEWPGNSAGDRAKCYAVEHRGGSSRIIMNGHYFRVNSSGVAQVSSDGSAWTSLATV